MKTKKWKDVRNSLTMVLVLVAMMSSATYAWFSITSSPTVTGLELTAATTGGLKVSKPNENNFVDAIDISDQFSKDENYELTPVSIKDQAATFYEPVYVGDKVTELSGTAISEDQLSGYVAKYEYKLRTEGSSPVMVGIMTADPNEQVGTIGITGEKANLPGTFVRVKEDANNDTATSAIMAVRIGLVVENKLYIYEPNYEDDNPPAGATYATNAIAEGNWPVSDVISGTDGKITTGAGTNDYTSKGLFTATNETNGTPVTMYIWLEGNDVDCVDQIQKDIIEAQIQFTAVKGSTSSN